MMIRTLAAVGGIAACSASAQDFLLIADSTSDTVGMYNAFDGSLMNANFLDIAANNGGASSTPIEVQRAGNEYWVSDQIADRFWRFDLSGNFLGDYGVDIIDNVRGFEVVGNTAYAAAANGINGSGIYTFDVNTGANTGFFNGRDPADTSYFDVAFVNGELLVSNIDTGNDGIERYDLAGNFLGVLFSSDGTSSVDFPQQIAQNSAGNLLVGGFSLPSGVYEIGLDGTDFGIVAGLDAGPRGVIELGNGQIAYTNGGAFQSDSAVFADTGSYRYITLVPAPSTALALLGLAATTRRRR